MEKYGTYRIFQNTVTKEIKRLPIDSEEVESMEKTASSEWIELDHEVNNEN